MDDATHRIATEALRTREPTLIIGPRPGKKSLAHLQDLQLTHVCSLLHEHETPQAIRALTSKIGCAWLWLPIAGGHLDRLREVDLKAHVIALADATSNTPQPRVYLHCSAGIHRTGFFAYALLRLLGRSQADALTELKDLRAVTAEQVGADRLALADEMIETIERC